MSCVQSDDLALTSVQSNLIPAATILLMTTTKALSYEEIQSMSGADPVLEVRQLMVIVEGARGERRYYCDSTDVWTFEGSAADLVSSLHETLDDSDTCTLCEDDYQA